MYSKYGNRLLTHLPRKRSGRSYAHLQNILNFQKMLLALFYLPANSNKFVNQNNIYTFTFNKI